MTKKILRVLLVTGSTPVLFQVGCLTLTDVDAIAQGQFIMFVNALLNAFTADVITAALGG